MFISKTAKRPNFIVLNTADPLFRWLSGVRKAGDARTMKLRSASVKRYDRNSVISVNGGFHV